VEIARRRGQIETDSHRDVDTRCDRIGGMLSGPATPMSGQRDPTAIARDREDCLVDRLERYVQV
jgi:hypothetical protein